MDTLTNIERIEKIKIRLSEMVKKNPIKALAITDAMGFETDGKKKIFHAGAQKAGETQKYFRDEKNIYWIPLIFNKQVMAVCGLKGYKEYPKNEAELLTGLVDQVAYDIFLERQIKEMIDPKSNFIKELLLTDKFQTFEEAIDRGDILGINLRAPQAVILIHTPGLFKSIHKKNSKISKNDLPLKVNEECNELIGELSAGFQNYEQNIFSCLEPDLFICLKWARGQVNTLNTIKFFRDKAVYISQMIEKKYHLTPTLSVGQYYPGLAGLKKSYHDAKAALELGEKIWGEGKIYHIVDIGMFVALTPTITFERKNELAFQIMGKVFVDRDLYKTVTVFLENNMNLSLAAKSLHVHRNTLIYRLNKIKKAIGLDPRRFSDAVQLKLGLILYDPNNKAATD